ncbi:hypothetical protein, partial [Streptomyces sp. P17]|uniref:hypothetical protein n=1 Tax=Streptomyces sp. P17 TaxID=3074716 RepID=UPI0028F3F264
MNLFGRLCEKEFGETLRSEKPQDVNLALYCVIAKVFAPFSMPSENAESVAIHMKGIKDALSSDAEAFDAFFEEIIGTDFLKNTQQDCLE